MTNNNELNNKSIEDLRKISSSLGLKDSENYNIEELKHFIEKGKLPNKSLSDDDLNKLKVSELRDLAKECGIEKSYSLKKDELIEVIKEKRESKKI